MRKDITVSAQVRHTRGKNEARRMRQKGAVPAVLYGAYQKSVAIAVNPRDLSQILRSNTGHNTIFNLDVSGVENTPVMIVDWQDDPIKENLLHADLKRIDLSKRLRVLVPLVTRGEPRGVKTQSGLLEQVTREVEIECLPDDIPERFEVDVSDLLLGQNKRVSDLLMTESMRLISNPDAVIAHVVALRGAEAETAAPSAPEAAPEAATAEPEVIKKGKKEEEGEKREKGEKGEKKK
jgi:large subunit ribosomal protein L25